MIEIAVFDAKPYDRTSLSAGRADLRWRFLDFRLIGGIGEFGSGADGGVRFCE
jgi:hypothetical protein